MLEAGGAVVRKWVRPAGPSDLTTNHTFYVQDLDVPKRTCRIHFHKIVMLSLTFWSVLFPYAGDFLEPAVPDRSPEDENTMFADWVDGCCPGRPCQLAFYETVVLWLTFCSVSFPYADHVSESTTPGSPREDGNSMCADRVGGHRLQIDGTCPFFKDPLCSYRNGCSHDEEEVLHEATCLETAKWLRWPKTRDEIFGIGTEPWSECWAPDLNFG